MIRQGHNMTEGGGGGGHSVYHRLTKYDAICHTCFVFSIIM